MTPESYYRVENFVKRIMDGKNDPQHGLDHLLRVQSNAARIAEIIGVESKINKNLLMALCLLHDVPMNMAGNFPLGFIGKHLAEKFIIRRKLPGILDELPLTVDEKRIVFGAIVNHPHSIPYKHLNKNKDLYTKILQDADSLDYFSNERMASLEKSKERFFIYRIGSLVSGPYFTWGRKNMREFLNFPEIAEHFVRQYS